mgnify:CR=1 FL=1
MDDVQSVAVMTKCPLGMRTISSIKTYLCKDNNTHLLLLATTGFMAIIYGVWLFLSNGATQYDARALGVLIAGFAPLLVYSIYDYRTGLLLSIIATPLLVIPPIPHSFTSGLGDLFAGCSDVCSSDLALHCIAGSH